MNYAILYVLADPAMTFRFLFKQSSFNLQYEYTAKVIDVDKKEKALNTAFIYKQSFTKIKLFNIDPEQAIAVNANVQKNMTPEIWKEA